MTTPAGCSAWADLADLPAGVAELHSPEQWCTYLSIATDVLWSATARRWRGASLAGQAVLRAAPPRAGEGNGWDWHPSWGHCACYGGAGLLGPIWRGVSQHHEPVKVRLPHGDVTAVTSVTIDGATFTSWRLDGPYLVRTDGRGWPECHDRSIVTYTYGKPPPRGGVAAVVTLAVELGKAAYDGDADVTCRLPERTRSVSRQGITMEVVDPQEYLADGLTGISEIDMWIRAANPSGRRQTATAWSPDIARARRF
jgi:hypothetical protein